MASPAAAAPTLPRSFTIAGERTGYVEVELTKPLRPLAEDAPTVTLDGGGRFIVAVLRSASRWGTPEFSVFRMPDGTVWRGYGGTSDETLPAGRYRLYLGVVEPGSATLEFPALPEGSLAVAPEVHTPFEAGELQTRESGNVVRFGESHLISGGGMALLTATVAEPPPGTQMELCWYDDGAEDLAGEDAYAPGCPGGSTFGPQVVSSPGEGQFHLRSGGGTDDKYLGLGGNVTAPLDSPGTVDAWAMWMSYDFPVPPAPPPSPPAEEDDVWTPEPVGNPPPASDVSSPTWQPAPAPGAGVASLQSKRVVMRNGRGDVKLSCDLAGPCRGNVVIGNGRPADFAIDRGEIATVKVGLTDGIKRSVRRLGQRRAKALITSDLGDETRQLATSLRIVSGAGGR